MTRPDDLIGVHWRKSSYSGAQGDCVEVAFVPAGSVVIRDTKHRSDGALMVTDRTWGAFVRMSKHIR